MSADVLKEFLISLGVQVDESAFKKLNEGLAKVEKAAVKLTSELVVVSAAVTAAVTAISSKFEDLYYASQRLNSSVENIRGFGFAISQVGGDAQGARASLEGLASFMRSNPSGERFIGSLGVSTRDANGQLRQTTDIMAGLGKSFAQMPYYIAKVRAGMLGINEPTLQAMIRGPEEFAARFHAMAARVGVDQDKAAKASHDFMVQIRDLQSYLTLLGEKFLLLAQGPIERIIKGLTDLDRATGGVSTALIALGAVLGPIVYFVGPLALVVAAVAALAGAFVFLWDDFSKWKEGSASVLNWSAWSTELAAATNAIGGLADAFGALAATFGPTAKALSGLFGPVLVNVAHFALRLVTDVINTVTDLVHLVDDILNRRWAAAYGDANRAAHEGNGLFAPNVPGTPGAPQQTSPAGPSGPSPNPAMVAPGLAGGAQAVVGGAASVAGAALSAMRAKFAIDYLKSQGLSDNAARGSVAGSIAESRLDPNAVNPTSGAFGIGQWLGDRKAALFAKFGPNPNFDQQLQFLAQELNGGDRGGAAVTGSRSSHEALFRYITKFMRPKAGPETYGDLSRGEFALSSFGAPGSAPLASPGALAAANSNTRVSIAQTTTIHVTAPDAKSAGTEVAAAQERVHGNLLRNTKSALG